MKKKKKKDSKIDFEAIRKLGMEEEYCSSEINTISLLITQQQQQQILFFVCCLLYGVENKLKNTKSFF